MENSRTAGKKLFRSRKERIAQKKSSRRSKTKWWKNVKEGQVVPMTAIKVPFTAGSQLLKKFQEVTRRHGFPIKFIETSGYSLQNMLERSDPFREKECGRPDCFPCTSGGRGRCDRIGAAYRISCDEEECKGKQVYYEGESAHSGYTRGRAHLRGYRNKEKESVLWKHACNDHGGRSDVNYTMTVLKTYGRDNTTRKTNEAVRINFNTGVRLNSKAEYRQPTVPRLSILRSSNE